MKQPILVKVTLDDIQHGEALTCAKCPVALAFQKASGDRHATVVGSDEWRGMYDVISRGKRYPLEEWVCGKISAYDSEALQEGGVPANAMQPFEFTIGIHRGQ